MVASALGNNSFSNSNSGYSSTSINNINLLNNCPCGADHDADQHQSVMEGMPQDPAELVNDLIRMGHYSDRAQLMAQSWETNTMKADLWQLLEQGSLSNATESQKRICYDLIKMAGGVEEAFSAAFGPQAQEFFTDTLQSSTFRRREFLIKVAAAAAVVTLTGCPSAPPPDETPSKATTNTPNTPPAGLEKTNLKVGFLPITCATPIIMSEPLGFYTKYGLKVELVKMPSWAAIRDSAIAGELDAYHMLSPMPISMSLGLGSTAFPVKLASIENINGQAISVANQHLGKVKEAKDFKGFSIGIPFAFSMHNLLLRYYLAAGGLNPDKDVQLQVIPPADAIAKMTAGQLDAFILPDNVVQRSVFNKIGFIHILTKDIWAGHPCCAFAASQKWIDTNPNTFRAINKAIIDGAAYANNPKNREEIAKAIAGKNYLNQPEPVLKAVLTGKFEDGQGNTLDIPDRVGFDPYPWKSFAKWISSQLVRWNLMPKDKADYKTIAEQIYQTDLARELAKELGQTPPTETERTEKLKFDSFDPAKPEAYIEEQIKQFKV
ncbi:MAG: nitrate ABC transporter substrate-binding protein [Pseudanabaena frigida]|uniref:Nitrate ABC transporter substrate-binding protein n=1 Tax=Pseudanabaena frigida TaxID=945775 RepID=A0A2W4WA98_9CYAN|nr:MAG: nitrate ABC transporter substrate-binding protein [Pseudanabaena frigida]